MGSWNVNNPIIYGFMDFWSIPTTATVTNAGLEYTLGTVVVRVTESAGTGIPYGSTILRATGMLMIGAIEDTSGADNNLLSSDEIRDQTTGAYIICLTEPVWDVSASSLSGGAVVMGDETYNLASYLSGTSTTTIVFEGQTFVSTGNNLVLHDVQAGIRVYYSV